MKQTTNEVAPVVPPEEVARRIAELRRISFERQVPAQVVYHEPFQVCPWPGCGLRIAGIRFELEKQGDRVFQERCLKSFWLGPGLIGRCPKCGRFVLFDVESKQAVPDPREVRAPLLPDLWHQNAAVGILPKS